mmetsp:Transcript_31788/g.80385  ORF Transcript_31788/g.80385 Transcript_31788/m.80385 type:complete len:635 (+) Transcript_31788:129-2033(+)
MPQAFTWPQVLGPAAVQVGPAPSLAASPTGLASARQVSLAAEALAAGGPHLRDKGPQPTSCAVVGSAGQQMGIAALAAVVLFAARAPRRRQGRLRSGRAALEQTATCRLRPSLLRLPRAGQNLESSSSALKASGTSTGQAVSDNQKRRGILRSLRDLPKKEALGIELRRGCVYAAPVSVLDGSFAGDPILRNYELSENDVEKNKKTIREVLRQIVDDFGWKGVVGCSASRVVENRLGDKAAEVFTESLRDKCAFSHTVALSDASAYSDLVYGANADEACWRKKLILVCTLGSDLDMTLLADGRRCQNCRGPLCYDSVSIWRKSIAEALGVEGAPDLPASDGPDWQPWVHTVDSHLTSTVKEFAGELNRIIVVPSGRLASEGEPAFGAETFPMLAASAAELGCEVAVSVPKMEASIEGAALASVVELQTVQLLRQLKPLLKSSSSLQALSKAQLRIIFQRMDTSGDGELETQELVAALELIGIQRDAEALRNELDSDGNGSVSIDEFVEWWQRSVANAKVVTITSEEAWRNLVAEEQAAGRIILLQVTFTFCRSCRAFEPKFAKLANEYPNVRFVNLVGNGTIGAMEFATGELNVKASPAFFVFRNGELMDQWVGKKVEVLQERLSECIAKSETA